MFAIHDLQSQMGLVEGHAGQPRRCGRTRPNNRHDDRKDRTRCPATPPLQRTCSFVLHDLLKVGEADIRGYDEMDRDNHAGDPRGSRENWPRTCCSVERCGRRTGLQAGRSVSCARPTGSARPYAQLRDGGWLSLDADPELWRSGHALCDGNGGRRDFRQRHISMAIYKGPDPRCRVPPCRCMARTRRRRCICPG